MLPSSLWLLLALFVGGSSVSPTVLAAPRLAAAPRLPLPLPYGNNADGQRLPLRAHSLDRPALGRGAASAERNQGLRRRAEALEEDKDVVWEGLGWVQNGGTYSVPVEVGSPAHTFYLQIDTASADLLLASTLCLSSVACKALFASRLPAAVLQEFTSPSTPYVELYNPELSTSFASVNNNGSRWLSTFADGTAASGFAARERVAWGGVVGPQAGRLVVEDQVVGLINATNLTLSSQHISGVFGLGPPRLSALTGFFKNASVGAPVLSRLAGNSSLEYPLFGLHLQRNTTLGGSLTLGALDGEVVKDQSEIEWHPLVKFPPFNDAARQNETSPILQWAVQLSNITVNGTAPSELFSAAYPETRNETYALIDSGASGIFGPIEDVEYIFSLIDGSRMVSDGVWIAPCNTRATMTFSFGGRNHILQPSEWLIGRVSTNQQECLAWPVATPPSGDGIGWQLGTPFLRTVYSVFHLGIENVQEPLIGFMPLRNATSLEETPINVSSILDEQPFFTTSLPNVLLPTPTFHTPPYIFNTSAWYPTATAESVTWTVTSLPTRTEGLGSPTRYGALPVAQGGSITALPPGYSGLPTAGPVNSSVIHELQSARESIASVASVTWGAGLASGAAGLAAVGVQKAFAALLFTLITLLLAM